MKLGTSDLWNKYCQKVEWYIFGKTVPLPTEGDRRDREERKSENTHGVYTSAWRCETLCLSLRAACHLTNSFLCASILLTCPLTCHRGENQVPRGPFRHLSAQDTWTRDAWGLPSASPWRLLHLGNLHKIVCNKGTFRLYLSLQIKVDSMEILFIYYLNYPYNANHVTFSNVLFSIKADILPHSKLTNPI